MVTLTSAQPANAFPVKNSPVPENMRWADIRPDPNGHVRYNSFYDNPAPWQSPTGKKTILVLRVEFPDIIHKIRDIEFENAWFSDKGLGVISYFRMASNNTLELSLGSNGLGQWIMMPKSYAKYCSEYNNDQMSVAYALMYDCLEIAKKNGVKISEYDLYENGFPDITVFLFAGNSIRTGGTMIGDFALTDENQTAVMTAENYNQGDYKPQVLVHEMAHAVVPMHDLYDYSRVSQPVFGWDIMGDGLWQGYCGLGSFTRWKSRWVDLTFIDKPGQYTVDDLNGSGKNKAYGIKIPGSDREWLLLEHRERTGLDTFLNGTPDQGLCVYLVDDKRPYAYAFNTLSKEQKTHGIKFLKCLKPGDVLSSETAPSTNPYTKVDLSTPNVGIRNVSGSKDAITFTLSFDRPRLPVALVPEKVYCGKIERGASKDIEIGFLNVGSGTLYVILTPKSEHLTLDRKSFIGNDEKITATVDTAGLAVGKYSEIIIYSNRSAETSGSIAVEYEVTYRYGDLDRNDMVNNNDLLMFIKTYGLKADNPSFNADADFDSNGSVDFNDLAIMARNFGK